MFCFVLLEIKVEIVCWGSHSPCSCSFPPLRRTAASVSWVNYFFPSYTINQSINQSWGVYAGGRVASPTLRRHSWRSRLASPHAGSLPIPSNSQQEASTCRSHEFCGRPLGLLQVGLSLTETTRQAGSASGYRATCPYSRSRR